MHVTILFFGQLTEITGIESLQLDNVSDTDNMTAKLLEKFPALQRSKYVLAVDKKIIPANTILQNNSTIALLPPFSGG
jgi:sulfur-carrier protein